MLHLHELYLMIYFSLGEIHLYEYSFYVFVVLCL